MFNLEFHLSHLPEDLGLSAPFEALGSSLGIKRQHSLEPLTYRAFQDAPGHLAASNEAPPIDSRRERDTGQDEGGGSLLVGRDLCNPAFPEPGGDPSTLLHEVQQ